MLDVNMYQFTDTELSAYSCNVFVAVIEGLTTHGEIKVEHANRLLEQFTVIASRRGIFGRAFDRWFKQKDESGGIRIQVVRVNPA